LQEFKQKEIERIELKEQIKFYERKEKARNAPKVLWVKNNENEWIKGRVVNLKDTKWEITYIGLNDDFNEWLEYDDKRISLTKPIKKNKKPLDIKSDKPKNGENALLLRIQKMIQNGKYILLDINQNMITGLNGMTLLVQLKDRMEIDWKLVIIFMLE